MSKRRPERDWFQEQELYNWQYSIPNGLIKFAYKSLRAKLKYMREELVKDCARRGG
jgi:hypothetical protein